MPYNNSKGVLKLRNFEGVLLIRYAAASTHSPENFNGKDA